MQQSSRKALNQTLVDSSQLEPDANIATQRFNLTKRRRIAPLTGLDLIARDLDCGNCSSEVKVIQVSAGRGDGPTGM
ncbi:hypothetical protein F511_26497 [Dorcoceras hygrometricum]|uniref:Uncharacterized protein n=1 Tax=Dorcoceras hygrometricum TaxID=472368 RepID=A0A2Z7BH67_9LAMI|nr:hypothetical protein F511_26497 [Dorcoceras hygrometricum]